MKINAHGSALLYSSYLGGDMTDGGDSIAVDAGGNAYVTGHTGSPNFPTTIGAFESPFKRFVSKIAFDPGDKVGNPSTHVSAASYIYPSPLAPESIVSAFGSNLATTTASATSTPLPTTLGGTTVMVDGRAAQLFFVSPTQINYLIPRPPEPLRGILAPITILSGDGSFSTSMIETNRISPGVFSADASGGGLVAGIALRQKPDNTQTFESIVRFDPTLNKIVAIPIDLGPEGDRVFLAIFGTGWRFRSSETAGKVKIGGVDVPVLYIGLQPTLFGVDQINVELTRTLAGKGEVDLEVMVDDKLANRTRVTIK